MGTLRFILGRAGTGKTRYCVDQVARRTRTAGLAGPGAVLLVPEQATFQMSRMLATWRKGHGYIHNNILSFKSLAHLALEKNASIGKPMLDFSRRLVMQQILAALQDRLKFWSNVRPERIAQSILQLMDELTQAELKPEDLETIFAGLKARGDLGKQFGDKLSDIILIAREYLKMDLAGLDDPLAYLDKFRSSIARIDWLKRSSIYIDGFAGFTGQQLAALMATAQIARETTITLSLDPDQLGKEPPPSEFNYFWPSEQTYFRLLDIAKKTGIETGPSIILRGGYRRRFRNNPILQNLEQAFTGQRHKHTKTTPLPIDRGADTVLLVSAEDPRHEVELVAGKILQLAREKNFQFRNMSVILRNLDSYEHLIRYTFEQYKIPYFLDIRRPIAHHPLTRMIQSVIGSLATGFETRWILRYLKSGMTNLPEHAADRIENYVLAHGIDKKVWFTEWRYKIDNRKIDEDDPTAPVEEFNLQSLNGYRVNLLQPLLNLSKFLTIRDDQEQAFPIAVLLDGLTRFLNELDVLGQLDRMIEREMQDWNDPEKESLDQNSQIHRQIWDTLIELFSQLQITLADRDLSLDQFLNVLTDSFAELDVGVIPSLADQVLVGTIDRTRHPDVRATFILGFNEGVWPQPPEEDVVLTDPDREKLAWIDLPQKANLEEHYLKEQYLTYIGFTRADDFLWVSFSRRGLNSVALQPSRYFRRIAQYCGKTINVSRGKIGEQESFNGQTPVPLTPANLVGETIIGLRTYGFTPEGNFWVALADQIHKNNLTRDLFDDFALGLCDGNNAELSPEMSRGLFPDRVSFSQIESYYRCPFQHFCRYGLRLQVAPRYRLEPVDLGQFRHAIMADAWKKIIASGDQWNRLAPERIEAIVAKSVITCAEQTKSQVLFSSSRNHYIMDRTRDELTLAIKEQLRMLSSGTFKPGEFEKPFEYHLDVDGKTWQLVGRIDRIDLSHYDHQPWVMILDYKSRQTIFKLKDWLAGVQMQLPGYLFISTLTGEKPAGAIFLSLTPQKPKSDGCFFPAAGLICFQALETLADPKIGDYPYCIKIKKDGQPSETGPVAVLNEEIMARIMKKTRSLVVEGLEGMTKGKIEIRPYYDGYVSVCPHCELSGVCRFDHHVNKYRVTPKLERQDVFQLIKESK